MTQLLHDEDFGDVEIRRHPQARALRFRVAPNGKLRVSAPKRISLMRIRRSLDVSRNDIMKMIEENLPQLQYSSGDQIGKSHHIHISHGAQLKAARHGLQISVTLAPGGTIESPDVQSLLRPHIIAALRKEAKSYLPRRLAYLAAQHNLHYKKVQFVHAGSRWGSCSSSGTISLNIALMKLPFPLIDYVLIHELCHTVHMNHSADFWSLVESIDADFHAHRQELKHESPII